MARIIRSLFLPALLIVGVAACAQVATPLKADKSNNAPSPHC